ncbi:MAG: 7TM diverse intracellular signaling domain-containing protein [Pseudomonadota bacterium]
MNADARVEADGGLQPLSYGLRVSKLRGLCCALVLCCFPLSAFSFESVPTPSVALWIERDGKREVPENPLPPANELWESSSTSSVSGSNNSVVWLRIEVPELPLHSPERVLVIGPAYLDHAVLYRSGGSGPELDQAIVSGDAVPFSEKPYKHRLHVFPLGSEAGVYYLRASSSGVLRVDWSIQAEGEFLDQDRNTDLVYAILLGVLAAMILFNIGVLAGIGDLTYLYYVAYHISAAVVIASLSGYAAQHLWPFASNSTNYVNPVALTVMCLTGIPFVSSFIGVAEHLPKLARQMRQVYLATAALMAPAFFLPYYIGTMFIYAGIALTLGSITHMIVAALKARVSTARYIALPFLLSICPGALGALFYQFGALPENFFFSHLLEVTTALETLLLSLFMAYRIKVSEREKLVAQAETLALERDFNQRMLTKQEEDRSRIARELHDSVGPNLSALSIHLQSMANAADHKQPMMSPDDALLLLRESIGEVRQLSHTLHPSQLDRLSLANAIEVYCRQFQTEGGLEFRFDLLVEEHEIDEEKKIHLYRIVQEAVHNVVVHAQATLCSLSLERVDGRIVLTVRDNGCGFEQAGTKNLGLGMTSMSNRADVIDAKFTLASKLTEGTKITVELEAATA